jgi:hypothetical protein
MEFSYALFGHNAFSQMLLNQYPALVANFNCSKNEWLVSRGLISHSFLRHEL